jgi:hypothetical protein
MLGGQGMDIECQASPQPSSDDLDGQVLLFNVLAPSAVYSYLCLLLAKSWRLKQEIRPLK